MVIFKKIALYQLYQGFFYGKNDVNQILIDFKKGAKCCSQVGIIVCTLYFAWRAGQGCRVLLVAEQTWAAA